MDIVEAIERSDSRNDLETMDYRVVFDVPHDDLDAFWLSWLISLVVNGMAGISCLLNCMGVA